MCRSDTCSGPLGPGKLGAWRTRTDTDPSKTGWVWSKPCLLCTIGGPTLPTQLQDAATALVEERRQLQDQISAL